MDEQHCAGQTPGHAARRAFAGGGGVAARSATGSRLADGVPDVWGRVTPARVCGASGEGRQRGPWRADHPRRQGRERQGDHATGHGERSAARSPEAGRGSARRRSRGRAREGRLTGRAPSEVSQRPAGMGLAVGVSCNPVLCRSGNARAAAPPLARIRPPARGQGRRPGSRHFASGHLPVPAAQLRDPLARSRLRHTHNPGTAGASRREHDHDLCGGRSYVAADSVAGGIWCGCDPWTPHN
jgi:hypothetical protein